MYGMNTLPTTGLAASGVAASAMYGVWMALLLLTLITVVVAVTRLVPVREY